MALYTGPNRVEPYYICKFVRVGEHIYVTDPNDIDTEHAALARVHNVHEKMLELIYEKPNKDEVDAGQLAVMNRTRELSEGRITDGRIRAAMYSMTYQIPVANSLSRVITAELLGVLNPTYDIKYDIPSGRGRER